MKTKGGPAPDKIRDHIKKNFKRLSTKTVDGRILEINENLSLLEVNGILRTAKPDPNCEGEIIIGDRLDSLLTKETALILKHVDWLIEKGHGKEAEDDDKGGDEDDDDNGGEDDGEYHNRFLPSIDELKGD